VRRRRYHAGEAASGGYRLVLTATGDRDVDQQVHDDADRAGVWVNSADDPGRCSFTLPAVVRRGPVQVAVSTGGASPALATWLRDRIAQALPDDLAALAHLLAAERDRLHAAGRSTEEVDWGSVIEAHLACLRATRTAADLAWQRTSGAEPPRSERASCAAGPQVSAGGPPGPERRASA
jgi:siroheme synthase-like protein